MEINIEDKFLDPINRQIIQLTRTDLERIACTCELNGCQLRDQVINGKQYPICRTKAYQIMDEAYKR